MSKVLQFVYEGEEFCFTEFPTGQDAMRLNDLRLCVGELVPGKHDLDNCFIYPADAYEVIPNSLYGGNLGLRCTLDESVIEVPEIYAISMPGVDFNRGEVDLSGWKYGGSAANLLNFSTGVKVVRYCTDTLPDLSFCNLVGLEAVIVSGKGTAELAFPFCIKLEEVRVFNPKVKLCENSLEGCFSFCGFIFENSDVGHAVNFDVLLRDTPEYYRDGFKMLLEDYGFEDESNGTCVEGTEEAYGSLYAVGSAKVREHLAAGSKFSKLSYLIDRLEILNKAMKTSDAFNLLTVASTYAKYTTGEEADTKAVAEVLGYLCLCDLPSLGKIDECTADKFIGQARERMNAISDGEWYSDSFLKLFKDELSGNRETKVLSAF